MSRRFAKRFVPLLVGLVALILGILAMGTSFAAETAGPPGDGGPQISQPRHDEPGSGSSADPQPASPPDGTDPHGCSSCMGDGED